MRKLKKTAAVGMIFMLIMTICFSSFAFADNGPSMGGMNGGQPQGMPQQSGNGGQPQGMPQQSGNGAQPQGMPQQSGNGGQPQGTPQQSGNESQPQGTPQQSGNSTAPSGSPNANGMQNGNNQMRPDENGIDMMAIEAYLATDDADENVKAAYDDLKKALSAAPGDENSSDIETLQNTLQEAIENADVELSDYANKMDRNASSINLQAVEAYLASDDADENVKTAYDALQTALTSEPDEEEENDIAELESSLESALETANVDLDDYLTEPDDMPMGNQPGSNPQNAPEMSINMKAVEEYLATDDADEDVKAAYDALEEALTAEPGDDADNDIKSLETALETALESAGIDLSEYDNGESIPENEPQNMNNAPMNDNAGGSERNANGTAMNENAGNSELTEQESNIIQAIWNRIISLFR